MNVDKIKVTKIHFVFVNAHRLLIKKKHHFPQAFAILRDSLSAKCLLQSNNRWVLPDLSQ